MPWSDVLANWPHLIRALRHDFPHLEHEALCRFRGDRANFETYLGDSHDLTAREARDVLSDWLMFKAPKIDQKLAA